MNFPRPAVILLTCVLAAPLARAIEWLPISDEDRAATASKIDPEAGAEVLYHVKQIDDKLYEPSTIEEYVRIKVYDEKGVRALDKVDIEYDSDAEHIVEIEARTIRPDGTIVEVGKKAFYERDIRKYGNTRERVHSFSFSALEPGVIVEYKYLKERVSAIFALRFRFMHMFPSRHVVFKVKPVFIGHDWKTEVLFYRCADQKMEVTKDGFNTIEMRDLPALADEPFMPPENDTQPWILFYPREGKGSVEPFWKDHAKDKFAEAELYWKRPSKLVRETAKIITAGASTPQAKLDAINDYCRFNILNLDFYTPHGGLSEKEAKIPKRTPDDLIKTKRGRSEDIQALFVTLARTAGVDARGALCSDSRNGAFNVKLPLGWYLSDQIVAAKIDNAWRFYDPARRLVPSGSLRWRNEGMPVLIGLPKGIEWAVTPVTPAEKSLVKRTATLRLNDEGTLMGSVRIEYSGHAEVGAREDFYWKTREKIEEIVRDRLKARLPMVEVTDIKVPDADDLSKPLVLTYDVSIPGYAEGTGQRFFLQPGFFTKGHGAIFTATTRTHDIYFDNAWAQDDTVSIRLPAGFRLEQASAPHNIAPDDWGKYAVSITFTKSTSTITYNRSVVFALRRIPAKNYRALKRLFEMIHERDSHTLTLRLGE